MTDIHGSYILRNMEQVAKKTKLSDIAYISSGYSLRVSVESLEKGDTPLVQLRNVNPYKGIAWQEVVHIHPHTTHKLQWLCENDILFAARNAHNYAICLKNVPEKALCVPHFFVIRVHDSHINPDFIAWQINQMPVQRHFQQKAGISITNNITRGLLEDTPIIVPPLSEQKQFVALYKNFLEERHILESLITNREKQMKKIAQNILEWI